MKIKINSKKMISVALIGLLCCAIYLNWNYNSSQDLTENDKAKLLGEAAYVNNDVTVKEPDRFELQRTEREKNREYALEIIDETLQDASSDEETKKNARTKKLQIADYMIAEADCETILKGKGFEDVLVTLNNDEANVLIKSETLVPIQMAQIQEVISSATGISPEKIKIVLSR